MKQYFINLGVSLDQLINTVLGGHPDETLSSRCGKREATCQICSLFCRFLDIFDKNHCVKHIEYDEQS